jgi:hypothetical protein
MLKFRGELSYNGGSNSGTKANVSHSSVSANGWIRSCCSQCLKITVLIETVRLWFSGITTSINAVVNI